MRILHALVLAVATTLPGSLWAGDTLLMADNSIDTVAGARIHGGRGPELRGGESGQWKPSAGTRGGALAAGVIGGFLGGGISDRVMQQARDASVADLAEPAQEDNRLQELLLARISNALEAQGSTVSQTITARRLERGFLSRVSPNEDVTQALLVMQRHARPPVEMSWDDRHVLVGANVELSERRGQRFSRVHSVQVQYVSPPMPGDDPLAAWAADGQQAFFATVERGIDAVMALALDRELEVPRVARNERAEFEFAGTSRSFRGRLLHRDGALAVLATRDGLMVIDTGSY
ncbi:hypothetical protein [Alkalisalibacterium limincola]|uniref:Uncharacterized protein n=1 Tax=Alkalisalibacterium limincola TaxID=2699169 RepID=A0A5C8KR41_9GAMM|nr:hypothetical protein [Alkalisalibacterium limincola]TXK62336.1 hypothetical protein FU658_08890 [Alkalisalibacterium limincola]